MRRALVSGLLAEEFGPAIASDPKFQELVDGVMRAMRADEACAALLDAALAEQRRLESSVDS